VKTRAGKVAVELIDGGTQQVIGFRKRWGFVIECIELPHGFEREVVRARRVRHLHYQFSENVARLWNLSGRLVRETHQSRAFARHVCVFRNR
jgi:hypothetical protein